ncbi:hypothetical protein BU25DRAFT_410541 [Macroventuria anomochaeta]|uniref:Uncharacterized protein n=2 Tax=Macroventuria anomochaeta TaxID=301207 RepID=A0ACB6S1R0_9PLEO|nr:uncharacterized protein BU25DRAFT_413172 [Macroventuria anomochaeta]XP_033562093.1 uncharacterized protein BU25DRAFT_410541 [Macroventuria anomochaeta]KAF2625012.1 hypothetical protein BU25DRAFT_413172 [Macroventuria anomochaeta]KAF2627902.1 hypothetical protein BU25DRAFT_410541 [Macroventuria anomochaeta]
MTSDQLYQSMLLAYTSTQLLCPLVFCLGRVAFLRRESTRAANSDNDESNIGLNIR